MKNGKKIIFVDSNKGKTLLLVEVGKLDGQKIFTLKEELKREFCGLGCGRLSHPGFWCSSGAGE